MAKFEEYTTRIFLNDEQAQDKIEKLRNNIKRYKQDKQDALAAGGKDGDKAWKEADRNIRRADAEMRKLTTTAQSVNRVLKNLDTSSVKDIRRTIDAINKELASGSVRRNSAEWHALNAQLKRARTELAGIEAESRAVTKKGFFASLTDSLNKNWGAITQFIGGITMLSMTIRQATKAYADMEEEMANVRKYTGQSAEEIKAMNEEFKAIDTRTSREELNQLAGAAGRLGITAHDDIMQFVDAADKINVALGEDLGEDAVATIGKLAMAFGEDETMGLRSAMLATGSAINEMAQNSSASASYLVDFTARLSGIGQVAGLTQAELIGLGSVMDENMQRDEMSSTALSNLITKLATDSSKFAKIAGINVKEFADLVATDMNGALLKFAKTLQGKGGLMKLAPMFDQMGLDGSRAVGVLTVLANKVDDVRKNQELATKAYKEGNSVINEFNVQNNTVQAGIDKNVKRFKDLSIELGEKLLPIVKYTISGGALLVKTLSALIDWISKYKTTIVAVTATLVILNAQKLYSITLTKLEVLWTNKLKKAVMAAWAAMKKNPYTVIATAIVAISALVYDLIRAEDKHVEAIKKEQEEAKEFQKSVSESAAQAQAKYSQLQKEYQKLKTAHEKRDWIKKNKQNFDELGIAVDDVNTAEKVFVKNTKMMMEAFKKRAEAAAWQTKLEQMYVKRNDRQAEIDNKKASIYAGAAMPKGSVGFGEGDAYVNNGGYLVYTEQGANKARAALDEDNELKRIDNEINDITKHAVEAKNAFNNLLETVGADTDNTGGGNSDDSDKERNKKRMAAEKKEKDSLNRSLADISANYAKGLMTYSDYLDKQEALQLKSIEKRKQIWGKQSDEYGKLEQEQIKIQQQYAQKRLRQRDIDVEHERVVTSAKIEAIFYDRNSKIYMNEDALNEALYQNDIDALKKMLSYRQKGTEQYMKLEADIKEKEQLHSIDSEIQFREKLLDLRKNYGDMSAEDEMEIALNGLEELHKRGLIEEEEYQKMKLEIKARYAVGGPDYNTERFNQRSGSILALAKQRAGDASNPENDNTMAAIFRNDLENWKNVNEQIALMEEQGIITHAEANASKLQNDGEYLDQLLSKTQLMYSMINNVVSAAAEYSNACSDLEVAKIKKNYDIQIKAAGNNSKKKERLEKKRDEEIRSARTKANKKAMKIQIAQAIATSAMSALEAYASVIKALPYPANMMMAPVAAGMALAAGALQIATIKKQNAAQEAGYYEGGFTYGRNYHRRAGIVHEGEFVANHKAVENPNILPTLQMIDAAQRNNTVASLTAADISRAIGAAPVVTPIVNVTTDNGELKDTMTVLNITVDNLQKILDSGIPAYVMMEGDLGVYKQTKRYEKLLKNK